MAMTKKGSSHVCRSSLKTKKPMKPGQWNRRHKSSWPCKEMSTKVWEREEGNCEGCGQAVPLGTPAAHLIPKSAGSESSHEPWNLALLCIVGASPDFTITVPGCHDRLDSNRAKTAEEPWLKKRIAEDERLRVYFERQVSRAKYRLELEEGREEGDDEVE